MKQQNNPLYILFQWAGKQKFILYLSMFFGLISGLMVIVPYMVLYKIMEQIYYNSLTPKDILKAGIFIMVSVIVRFGSMGIGIVLSHKGAYNSLYQVRQMIVNHMARIPLGFLSQKNTGEIKKLINEDIEKLELFLAHHLPELVMYSAGPLAIFVYLCTVNPILALISLLPIPVAILLQYLMFRNQGTRMGELNRVMTALNASMIEYISGMKLIKAYDLGVSSYKKYSDSIEDQHTLWKKTAYSMGPLFAVFVIILQSAVILLVPAGGFLFNKGHIGAGVFILFAFVGSMYLNELRPFMELGSNFAQVLNGVNNAKKFLELPVLKDGGKPFPNCKDIAFHNVSFSYDESKEVLKGVNVHIKDKEKIALVGYSGSGKSTIIQLISRFYDVSGGKITIGGVDIRELSVEELQSNISYVFQNTFLSKESIFENIRMGTSATKEEVEKAAKAARIHDFILSLPMGYDTKVGSYGSRFSGGEKQRIAIARAFVKNSPILILDEATSAADPENQKELNKALSTLCMGKTVIIVAHRLNTIKDCNRIAVVEEGKITDFDSHEKLLTKNAYYKKVWGAYNQSRNIIYDLKAGELNG
jgi:ATP-binding cassette subfamily B protein